MLKIITSLSKSKNKTYLRPILLCQRCSTGLDVYIGGGFAQLHTDITSHANCLCLVGWSVHVQLFPAVQRQQLSGLGQLVRRADSPCVAGILALSQHREFG